MTASIMPDHAQSKRTAAGSPFFTVLIPTMNRPQLLAAAVKTVLWQTFNDFELIVSDNSNDEACATQNRAIMERHADDPRVHYIRPGTWMNMPDHWEFASRHASGRYVVILTDRHVMRPSALELLHSRIVCCPEEVSVVSWMDRSEFNERSGILTTGPFGGHTEEIDSKTLIRDYAQFSEWEARSIYSNRLPRMLNSCYRFDLAETIRKQYGRLFIPVAPDYCAAFLQLAHTDRILYVDRPLFVSHGNMSNGRNALVYGTKSYVSTLGDMDAFEGTPIRVDTPFNLIVRDLLAVKRLVGDRLKDVEVDLVGYYMVNYGDILQMERLGSPRNIKSLYALWWKGVAELPQQQQARVKGYVKNLNQQRASWRALRRLAVRMGVYPLLKELLGWIRHIRQRVAGEPLFTDVFDAALKTNDVLTDECANKVVKQFV